LGCLRTIWKLVWFIISPFETISVAVYSDAILRTIWKLVWFIISPFETISVAVYSDAI
jgi:hypothetical protein